MERHNQLKILDFIKHSRCLRYVAVLRRAGGEGGRGRTHLAEAGKAISHSPQAHQDGSSRCHHGMKAFNKALLRKAECFMLSTWPVAFLGRRDDFN